LRLGPLAVLSSEAAQLLPAFFFLVPSLSLCELERQISTLMFRPDIVECLALGSRLLANAACSGKKDEVRNEYTDLEKAAKVLVSVAPLPASSITNLP
jgi:hypothetical protein